MRDEDILARLDACLAAFGTLPRNDRRSTGSWSTEWRGYERSTIDAWVVRAEAALVAVFLPDHPVLVRWREVTSGPHNSADDADRLRAILGSARAEIADGYVLPGIRDALRAASELELLDQAVDLAQQGQAWLPAAMVTAGAALEMHLRYLCTRHGASWKGHGSIGAYAEAIRGLRASGRVLYPPTDDRQIDLWRDQRNIAAHRPTEFAATASELTATLSLIRAFIERSFTR